MEAKLKILAAILAAAIVGLLIAFQSYLSQFAYDTLQGCWEIDDSTFIVFDDASMQVLALESDGGYKRLHQDPAICCRYTSLFATAAHQFTITRSKDSTFNHPLFRSDRMTIKIYPVLGAMSVIEDGAEVSRLIKDNAMSIEYLS